MKYLIVFFLFNLSLSAKIEYTKIPHLDSALSYVGVKEKTGKNDGKEVEMFLRETGLGKGYAWCASFVSYITRHTKGLITTFRTAVAQKIKTLNDVDIKDVLYAKVAVRPGWVFVMKNGSTAYGHTGFVYTQLTVNSWTTVEGNINNRVNTALRQYNPRDYQRIIRFVPVIYKDSKMNKFIDTVQLKPLVIKGKTSSNTR